MQQATYVPTGFGANDVQIMAGTFDEFSFDDVVQVLGLSRQCLRLLIRQGEAAFSEILLKAGQVLEARMPASSDPENVFKTLFGSAVRGSGLSFSVYHTEPTGPYPMPRCRLQEVYERVKSTGPATGSMVARPGSSGTEPTLRLTEVPSQVRPRYAGSPRSQPGPSSASVTASPVPSSGAYHAVAPTAPALSPEAWGRATASELQPLLRNELGSVLGEMQAQAKALHMLDGRLQVLPQLVAAELRAALAQHERQSATPAPPPAPPAESGLTRGLLLAMGVGQLIVLLAVVALAVRVLG